MPGVEAVFTADDLAIRAMPPSGNVESDAVGTLDDAFGREVLARDVVRFVGEPLALVVAEFARRRARTPPRPSCPTWNRCRPSPTSKRRSPTTRPCCGPTAAPTSRRCVRGAVGRRRAGWLRRDRARPVREPAPRPRADGTQRDRRRSPTATVGSRCGSRRRCRSTCATTWPNCSRCRRSRCARSRPDVGGGFGAKLQIYPEYQAVAVAAATARPADPLGGDPVGIDAGAHARAGAGAAGRDRRQA